MGPEQWIAVIILWLVILAIAFTALYWVIRLAVTHALRAHAAQRGSAADSGGALPS